MGTKTCRCGRVMRIHRHSESGPAEHWWFCTHCDGICEPCEKAGRF